MRIGQDSIPYVYSLHVPVHLVAHPVAQDALLALRDATTRPSHFRRLAHRLSLVVTLDATSGQLTAVAVEAAPSIAPPEGW